MIRKLIPIALLMSVSACETANLPPDAPEVALALAVEQGAQLRCPRNQGELSILINARAAFDAFTNIGIAARALVDSARVQTNIICNLTQP